MRAFRYVVPFLALGITACSGSMTSSPTPVSSQDGLTLTTATQERVTGSYDDGKNHALLFDSARVGDDLFFDLRTGSGQQLIHIETVGDNYEFSYMGGQVKMHTNKAYIAQMKAQDTGQPTGMTSTDGFVWEGDMNALDQMLQVPDVAALPWLSRALGARGFTGNSFPGTLALHKVARQSAEGLGIQVPKIDVPQNSSSYCQAYPNQGNNCYGMCGPGCSCWSWVCGDCCYHYGCARHDDWCRNGQWYYCYDITAVIALFGC
jgi:hypothetical protein